MALAVMCPSCKSMVPGDSEACPHCAERLVPDDAPTRKALTDPLFGMKLGEYRLEQRIGIGGMGYVYRAVHPLVGNEVAIKVLRPDVISTEADLQRFLGEAKAVNQVRHPGVVSIFGAGDTPDGRKYLVMELLHGESLEARRARDRKLPANEVLTILEEVLSALAAVHAAGVVHRDLKPANVFLARESNGRPFVKLLDFGLARKSNLKEVSAIAGTPDYISPEHARGKPAGPPADLYGLGVMAFHLLTGRLPFIGANPVEVMEKHVRETPPDPGVLDGSIPPAMCALILRLLAKDPAARPTVPQIRLELKAVSGQLRSAATQMLPKPGHDGAERPTAPELARLPHHAGDTDPVLGSQGPIPVAPSTPLASPTAIDATPRAVPPVRDTSPELPRRRWVPYALAGGLLLIIALSVKALLNAREPVAEPSLPAGRKALPQLTELPPEADWRDVLTERLERVQVLARETRATGDEAAAKKLLARVGEAKPEEQETLERDVEQLENRLAGR